jgi:threonine dehydratase
VAAWVWQAVLVRAELDDEGEAGLRLVGQAQDAEAADFEQAGEGGGGGGDGVRDVHLVVGDQVEAAGEKAEDEVGFAGARGTQQEDPVTVLGYAASVQAPLGVHRDTLIASFGIWKQLVARRSAWEGGNIMSDRKAIAAAASRLSSYVRHTPVMRVDLGLDEPVALKLELLQHAGSFKPRGAFNRLLLSERSGFGVIAASGGNHGAAVAYAARRLGLTAEIFVPGPTPAAKVARIAGYGATVVQGGASYAEALLASRERQAQTGALEVHAYDDADVLAGQGTVGREFEQDAPELTHILVGTGGGGLIGGIAAWYAGGAEVISVEPELCPALHDALRAGRPVDAPVGGRAADSLGARQVGGLMFPIARRFVGRAVLVADEAIAAAQRLLWEQLRLVVEPGGATALAGLLSGQFVAPAGARVGVVVCGANADPGTVAG